MFKLRRVCIQNQGATNFVTPFFLSLRKQCVYKLFRIDGLMAGDRGPWIIFDGNNC